MNRGSQRILILGGFAVAVIIIALLAVIALLLMGGDGDGSSEAARVTATATGSPTARATPRATATSTVTPSTPGPAGQQAAAVTTTAQQTPGAPQQTAAPSGQQPSSTAPPSAPPAATADACPGPPAVAFFTANPATITAGQSSTLDWGAVSNTTSVSVDQGIGAVPAPGSRVVTPATTTIYTLTITGCGGTVERQATVIVNPPPPTPSPTPSPTPTPTPAPPPGGGSWGITPIDLAVTGLSPDNLPQGEVWVTIANNGPYGLTNAQVTLGCSGTAYLAGGGGSVAIATMPWTISVNLDVGWSAQYDTTISVDTNQFSSYFLECSIEAVSFKDDITGNNSNSAWIP
jgi:hypothetical protein